MNQFKRIDRITMILSCLCFSLRCAAQDELTWSRFRGPNGTGILETCHVPIPWQPSDVQWSVALPGGGNGSPVLAKDRVFLLSADPKDATRYALCYSLDTGELLWKKDFASRHHALHKFSSYASSTPCVDEQMVYFAWADDTSLTVRAFTHGGDDVWTRDLGRYVSQHGFGTSPIRVDDKLILYDCQDAEELAPGVAPGKSRLLALSAKTGEVVWESPCTPVRVCYGVPCLYTDKSGKTSIIEANTGNGFFAVDVESGKRLWSRPAFEKRVCSSPIIAGNLVIGTEGSGGGGNQLVAVSADGSGQEILRISNQTTAPYVPTPVVLGDTAFLWADNGIVSCVELPTGKILWRQRIGGNVASSPVIIGGKLIGMSDDGVVTILAASHAYQKLGRIELGDVIRSTPAADATHLVIRTNSTLHCIGVKN